MRKLFSKKEKVYLFGDNEENRKIYQSKGDRDGVIFEEKTTQKATVRGQKAVCKICESFNEPIAKIVEKTVRDQVRSLIIINTGEDEKNLSVCRAFVNEIDKASVEEKDLYFKYLRIYVFGDPKYQAVYEDVAGESSGCISYVNKYQHVALDFIDRYPFTKFMDGRQIDYQTSLIRDNIQLNAYMVGFNETNQHIFLASVANNQFLCKGKNGPELKKVNYYIFDKNSEEHREALNGSYYRYSNEMADYNPDDYLPLPSVPAHEEYFDLSETTVFAQIKAGVERNPDDRNYVIVAFGSDLENVDMAQKLVEKRKAWNADNLVIFVKSGKLRKEDTFIEEKNCFFIGNEEDCVFNLSEILGDRIYAMSQLRNAIYDLEYELTNSSVEVTEEYLQKNRENATRSWFTSKSQLERDSSTYCCLSLRSKLNLMGLDYCGKEENDLPAMSQAEYLVWYAKGDLPDMSTYSITADGKPIVYYTLEFLDSRRKTMAIHEHQRWNSFMLSKGMVPATKAQILEEKVERNGKMRFTNGKNYAVRRHGNLTTFEGLIEFRQMVAKRDGSSEAEKDVIKYDYQLLDDAYWLVEKSGCKIVKLI